jgi:hypothetical protein
MFTRLRHSFHVRAIRESVVEFPGELLVNHLPPSVLSGQSVVNFPRDRVNAGLQTLRRDGEKPPPFVWVREWS